VVYERRTVTKSGRIRNVIGAGVVAGITSVLLGQQGLRPANDAVPPETQAQRVERVLREARSAVIHGKVHQEDLIGQPETVTAGLDPIEFRSRMTPDRLRSDVFKDGELIAAFSWVNGRIQEYRPRMKNRPLLEYDAPQKYGTDDTVLKTEYDCLIACATESWVGPHSHKASFFRGVIESAEQVADVQIGDRACIVFRRAWSREADDPTQPPLQFEQVLYVERESSLVVRWDTVNSGVRRIREYQYEKFDRGALDDTAWRITLTEDEHRQAGKAQGAAGKRSTP
jgi:hypothetical protein